MCRIFYFSGRLQLQDWFHQKSWNFGGPYITITDMCRFGCHPMELLARLSSVLLKCILFPAVVDEVPRYIFVMT